MEKPKVRIVLTVKKLYELAEKRYIDCESDLEQIRVRLADNYKLEITDVTPARLTDITPTPPNMVN